MLDKLIDFKYQENSVKEFLNCTGGGIPSAVFGISDAFKYYLVNTVDKPVLYVVKDNVSARKAERGIREFLNKNVVYLPEREETLLISKAFSKDVTYSRINALFNLSSAKVIVTTINAIMELCPLKINSVTVKRDEDLDRDEFITTLISFGYTRCETVEDKSTFAVRGDVIDVFPINSDNPIRIDFFGDTVESIKKFDGESRKNLGAINSVTVLQSSEYVSFENKLLLKSVIKSELSNIDKSGKDRLKIVADDIITGIENDDVEVLTTLSPLLKNCGTVFDLLSKDTVIILDDAKRLYEYATLLESEFNERFKSLYKSGEIFSFMKNNLLPVQELITKFNGYTMSALQNMSTAIPFFNPQKIINPQVSAVSNYHLDFKEVYNDISNWLYSGYSVCVCTGNMNRAEKFNFDLASNGTLSSIGYKNEFKGVIILTDTLSEGFIFHEQKIAVIGSGNLYGQAQTKTTYRGKSKNFFTAPEVGDYCVHEVHGIGKVLGSKKITSTEGTKDYIAVEYYGGDVLYIPVEQMDILSRYLGGDKKPKLSHIGGKDFEKIKNAVKESIKKMSFNLKKLYSERNASVGFQFKEDEELQRLFVEEFPFEDTLDQASSDKDVKEDMLSDKVMDRLICGDVGFGKTEIAFRAVFRAVTNGKQAVMLAPTTILTEQHYNTAVERFKNFGVRIACLNRFKTAKEQQMIIDKVKKGEIDFVIGTHRLLSKDVGFYDLGLLVLDEEQRFGVEHKEKIKLLKKNVDTLTLTATPIPRTLHMSLTGIRSISTINTPPLSRLPVQTYVTEETPALIKDAIIREINRGGQVFVLYNRVETIDKFKEYIDSLVSGLKITVVHGQMEERAMEKGIMSFYKGESQVLISTTIIENGIDLPKANTLIVIDADNLGLSTLYQLKGRVGRSDRLAYAYFTFKREKILTSTAYERLNAITDFTEMGSGIKIAMRDLEIRGAGNVLGAEQHGHMDKVGYELYSKLLREELTETEELIPELDIRVSAYIPESYIEGKVARMDAYKEIAEINSFKSEQEFISYAVNTFGDLPDEVINLINIAVVKRLAMKLNVTEITVKKEEVSLTFSNFKAFADEKLANAIDKANVRISMSNKPKLEFNKTNEENSYMLRALREFLNSVLN